MRIHHPRRLDPGPHRLRRTDRPRWRWPQPRRRPKSRCHRFCSAHSAFTAPASGLSIHPRSLRRGPVGDSASSPSKASAQGQVASTASLIFSGVRSRPSYYSVLTAPEVPGPHGAPSSRIRALSRRRSSATSRSRVAGGAAPISGAELPELLCWVRHLDATGIDPDHWWRWVTHCRRRRRPRSPTGHHQHHVVDDQHLRRQARRPERLVPAALGQRHRPQWLLGPADDHVGRRPRTCPHRHPDRRSIRLTPGRHRLTTPGSPAGLRTFIDAHSAQVTRSWGKLSA